jgi:hypothetical protein
MMQKSIKILYGVCRRNTNAKCPRAFKSSCDEMDNNRSSLEEMSTPLPLLSRVRGIKLAIPKHWFGVVCYVEKQQHSSGGVDGHLGMVAGELGRARCHHGRLKGIVSYIDHGRGGGEIAGVRQILNSVLWKDG